MQSVQILAPNDQFVPGVAQSMKPKTLTIQYSLQIKAAEYWLELGEPDQALRELEALPARTWTCGWALSNPSTNTNTLSLRHPAFRSETEAPTIITVGPTDFVTKVTPALLARVDLK